MWYLDHLHGRLSSKVISENSKTDGEFSHYGNYLFLEMVKTACKHIYSSSLVFDT